MRSIAVIFLGLNAVLLQTCALREILTVFSGNELDIGITLAAWLVAVGAGGFLGGKLRAQSAFPLSFLAAALLAPLTMLAIESLRPLLAAGLGETFSLAATVLATVLLLFPLGCVLGAQFPLAVSSYGAAAARVYGLEAAGSFLGGVLFTFVLAGRASALEIASAVGALDVLLAALLLRSAWPVVLMTIPLLALPLPDRIAALNEQRGVRLVERKESRYGTIEVLRIRDEYSVYASGRLQFSYPDPQREEFQAHLPMTLHPLPRRVLAIGGSPALARELLKYPVERIDFLELDPALISVSLSLMSAPDRKALDDARFHLVAEDGRAFIKKSLPGQYDLILLNLPAPETANINRCFTVEFFKEARRSLGNGGVLVLSLPPSFGYMSRELRLANGSIYRSLRAVFGTVAVSAEEYGVLAASDAPIETGYEALRKRFDGRRVSTSFFRPELLRDLFDPLSMHRARDRLETTGAVNTDDRPAAYLYNLMVWASMQGGGLLRRLPDLGGWTAFLAIASAAGAAVFFRRRTKAVSFTIFFSGSSAMAFSLIVLLAYQSAHGYVYQAFGLLTALFMAGAAIGAFVLNRTGRPLLRLKALQGGAAALFLAAPLAFSFSASFYLVNALTGFVTGAEFAAASRLREKTGSAGALYAIDLAGSSFGALLGTLVLVPVLGIRAAAVVVVIWKLISLSLLSFQRNEQA